MRIAAGACALAAGLLLASGGLATADPDSTGSSAPNQTAETSTSQTTSPGGAAADDPADTQQTTDSASTTEPTPVSTDETDPAPSEDESDSPVTPDVDDAQESAGTDQEGAVGNEDGTVLSDDAVTESDSDSTPSESTGTDSTLASDGSTGKSESTGSTPAPIVPPVTPKVPLWKAFKPVTNAVNTIAGIVRSMPQTLAALQSSRTPIPDAIWSVQAMLTSVADAVMPLGQMPADIYSLLGVPLKSEPPLIGGNGALPAFEVPTIPVEAPLIGPRASQVSRFFPTVPASTPLFGTMAPHQELGTAAATGLTRDLSLSGTVPLKVTAPSSAHSLFQHVIEAVLVPASLTALAAVALPGIGGLLAVCAAGVRFGYRQAKAALAVRASGIARFAGSGPLGIARSGSRVMLRQRPRGPRTKMAVCPEAARSRSTRHLETVA